MKLYVLILLSFPFCYCEARRNPFQYDASQQQKPQRTMLGRGIVHDKHMACEAYADAQGKIAIRWLSQQVVKKSPST